MEPTVKRFAYIVFSVCALLANSALSAPSVQNGELVEPLQRLYGDMSVKPENVNTAIKRNIVGEAVSGAIYQHSGLYMDDPFKAVPMIEYLTSRRVVTVDGRMASVYYHEKVKERLAGDMRLLRGQYIAWQKQYPESAAPIVFTAANMLSAYAIQLRMALVSLMPVEGIEVNRTKIEEVRSYLLENKTLGSKDPYWYTLMVETQIFLRVSEAELKATVEEGLTKFPENVDLPVLAASYYYSKWKGEASKLPDYAAWVVSSSPGKARADIYPRIYMHALQGQNGMTLFKLVAKDWSLMRNGIHHLMSAYPIDTNRETATFLACLGGDRELTRTMLAVDDGMTNQAIWIDRDAKNLCRSWARG